MNRQANNFYEFGEFRLDLQEHVLLRGAKIVPLTPKAFDVLVALVEQSGHVLGKDELMKQVWPDSFVEEANLSHHVFTLRKALGEHGAKYIETIPRRGYRFVADLDEVHHETVAVIERTRAHLVIEEQASDGPSYPSEASDSRATALDDPYRRRRLLRSPTTLALLATGLIVVGGVAIIVWQAVSGRQAEDRRGAAEPVREMKLTRVTNSGKALGAIISPDGKFISYFENHTSGAGTLYVKQRDTNNEIRLLEPDQRIFGGSAFSPDGSHIYYVVFDKRDPDGALYRIPVLGGPPLRLLNNFDSQFTLSPDGAQVAFYSDEPDGTHQSIVVATLDSGELRTLLTCARNETILSGIAAWSPDGAQITFAAGPARGLSSANGAFTIRSIAVAGGPAGQLSPEEFMEVGKMNWTPDGRGIVFVALRPRIGNQLYYLSYPEREVRRITNDLLSYGNYGLSITADSSAMVVDDWHSTAQLWLVGADGAASGARQLTLGIDDGARGLAPLDGGRIAYVSRNAELDIWAVNDDGTEARALTADEFSQSHLSTTPDRRYIVYASDRGGASHIYRMDSDGQNPVQLTYGESSDSAPACSPEGHWVAYTSTSEGKTTLWKVRLQGGAPSQLTDYESVAPAFSPDGRMISCVLPAATRGRRATIAVIPAEGGRPIKKFDPLPFGWYYRPALWTSNGQSLVFCRIENHVGNLWLQPLAGGAPNRLTSFKSDVIYNYAFGHDGKSLILSRGRVAVNVALIENFR